MASEKGGAPEAPFGLLGHPLGHSWSPTIHAKLGSTPYELYDLPHDEAELFLREGTWRGVNVTIPHKPLAAQVADACSPAVKRLGVANTLVRSGDGRIFAENTDVLGFAWMLERFCEKNLGESPRAALGGRKVLVLGSGGASRSVTDVLANEADARPITISRQGTETYETLADRHADAVLLVNTTPVGMFPHCPDSPVSKGVLASLTQLRGVLDVIYNPERTGLCLAAEKLAIPVESGLAMLVAQAFYASEIFQQTRLDEDLIGQIERDIRLQTQNVVLIGMPGAGKSSCGRALSRLMGRPFVDIDCAIETEEGRPAAQIIREDGEAAFREIETRVTGAHGARSGLVIACGGGVVTRAENYDLLHQNGIIVFLDRSIDELSTNGRPISQSRGVEEVARERMGLYESWADLRLACTGSAAGDAREILAKISSRDA